MFPPGRVASSASGSALQKTPQVLQAQVWAFLEPPGGRGGAQRRGGGVAAGQGRGRTVGRPAREERDAGHGGGGLPLPVSDRAAGGRGRGQDIAAAVLHMRRARDPRARAGARVGAHGGRRVLHPHCAASGWAARQAAALGHGGPGALQVRGGWKVRRGRDEKGLG